MNFYLHSYLTHQCNNSATHKTHKTHLVEFPTIRLTRVRSVEIELPGCETGSCALHTEREWPILEEICSHLGENLEELVIHLSSCISGGSTNMWIVRFAEEKMRQGINICRTGTVYTGNCFYFWAATSDTRMDKLIRRTVVGDFPQVWIYGLPELHIQNVLEMLSNLAEGEGGSFTLGTDTKLKRMDSMNHLKRCDRLELLNKEPIEDEEVPTMNAILAHIAANPTSTSLNFIRLPKVSS